MSESNDPPHEAAPSATAAIPPTPAGRPLATGWLWLPLLIGFLLLLSWLVFYWSLAGDDDPQLLLEQLRQPSPSAWRQATVLAESLRNPRNEALRQDAALCRELGAILEAQLHDPIEDASHRQLRTFLCRALGEFEVPDGVPALLQAVEVSQSNEHTDVQCAALEALARLAGNRGSGTLVHLHSPRAMTLLLEASQARRDPGSAADKDGVAATAAFVLGVVGGPQATQRLRELLDDPRADVRYNAATGLARHGDRTAMPVLREMLDTDTQLSLVTGPAEAAHRRRCDLIVRNGIRAAMQLFAADPRSDWQVLLDALERVSTATELTDSTRLAARSAR